MVSGYAVIQALTEQALSFSVYSSDQEDESMNLRIWIPFAILATALAQDPNRPPQGKGGPARPAGPQRPSPVPGGLAAVQPRQPPRPNGPAMPMQPPDFSALKTYLNLSDVQLQKLMLAREQAATQADEKVKSLMPQIRDQRIALQGLLDTGTNDPAAVGKMMLELHALEKQVQQAGEAARNSQLSVLTAEQRTKFKAIEEAAALPTATRDAMRLGLVPSPRNAPGLDMPEREMPRQDGGPRGPGPNAPGPGPGSRGRDR